MADIFIAPNRPHRRFLSRNRPSRVSSSTILAFLTLISFLLYISSTSRLFSPHPPILRLKSQISFPSIPYSVHERNLSAPVAKDDGGGRFDGDVFVGQRRETVRFAFKEEYPSKNADVFHDREIFLQDYQKMNKTFKIYVYPHNPNAPFANIFSPAQSEPQGNYASESYFKISLAKSNFITSNPHEADLFFLPFSIATMRHDPRIGVQGIQDFVKNYVSDVRMKYPFWNRTGGTDHFYVNCHSVGRSAIDKAAWVRLSVIQVVCSSSYFLHGHIAHKDVSLPQIWPRKENPARLDSSMRKKLAFYAGAMNSPVREKLIKFWKNDSEIFVHSTRLKTPYSEQLLGSKFCLHVKGFEVNTARIADSIFYGCVPVIIANFYELPFHDVLDWKSFSVVVVTDDIPLLKKILKGISQEEYKALQGNVLKVRRHFMWHSRPKEFDAFNMVMYELWTRRGTLRI